MGASSFKLTAQKNLPQSFPTAADVSLCQYNSPALTHLDNRRVGNNKQANKRGHNNSHVKNNAVHFSAAICHVASSGSVLL
jgi:hypothetical protein